MSDEEEELKKQDVIVRSENEGSPWFWKLFGGAIISIISVLFVLIISYITSTLNTNATESRESYKKLWQENTSLREKASGNEQSLQALKERMAVIEATLKERAACDKEQEKQIFELKEKILKLETRLEVAKEAAAKKDTK